MGFSILVIWHLYIHQASSCCFQLYGKAIQKHSKFPAYWHKNHALVCEKLLHMEHDMNKTLMVEESRRHFEEYLRLEPWDPEAAQIQDAINILVQRKKMYAGMDMVEKTTDDVMKRMEKLKHWFVVGVVTCARWCHCNAFNFLQIFTIDTHSSSVRASYVVPFVSTNSDWCLTIGTAMLYAISCYRVITAPDCRWNSCVQTMEWNIWPGSHCGATIMVPCHVVKSLLLPWKLSTRKLNLHLPDHPMSCRAFSTMTEW